MSKGELVSVTVVKLSGAGREFVCFGNGNGIVNRIGYQFLVPTEVLSISLSRRLSQPQINSQTESNEIIFISLGPDSRYKHPSPSLPPLVPSSVKLGLVQIKFTPLVKGVLLHKLTPPCFRPCHRVASDLLQMVIVNTSSDEYHLTRSSMLTNHTYFHFLTFLFIV